MLSFTLDGEDYYVEYEGLHWLCTNCEVYGHRAETCKTEDDSSKTGAASENNGVKQNTGDMEVEKDTRSEQDIWQVVQKQRLQRKGGKEKADGSSRNISRGSRFDILAGDEEGEIGAVKTGETEVQGSADGTVMAGIMETRTNLVRLSKEKKGAGNKRQTKSKNVVKESNIVAAGCEEMRKEEKQERWGKREMEDMRYCGLHLTNR